MTSFRLLPVVIAAALALLVLKGGSLLTDGGYIFAGASAVQAAGATRGDGDVASVPGDSTMLDSSPTLEDSAPTLPLGAGKEAGAHGEAGEAAAAGHGAVAAADCAAGEGGHGAPADAECADEQLADTAAEAVPMILDGAGDEVPLPDGGTGNEAAVFARLGDRREELDAREAELDMRLALIEAAEQRVDERTSALEELEARIAAMVEEKKGLEEEQFVAIVTMYESMKARDAAAIFDQLEMPVMLRVARAINPRKMAPIMAQMDPLRARDLTANMAIDQVETTIEMPGDGLAALPQIVGQ